VEKQGTDEMTRRPDAAEDRLMSIDSLESVLEREKMGSDRKETFSSMEFRAQRMLV